MVAVAESMTGRKIRVYCLTHKVGFGAQSDKPLMCADGGHALANKFPDQSSWEYCCDCQHCWLLDTANKEAGSKECPACEREIVRRYACDCNVISLESDEPARRKVHSLTAGAPTPNCLGCLRKPQASVFEHDCADYGARFLTNAAKCRFCDEVLEPPTEFPCTVAECLANLKSTPIELKFDSLKNELRPAAEGDYLLLPRASDASLAFVIPRFRKLRSKRDYYDTYYELFNCENPTSGEVVVVRPATVKQSGAVWSVNETGTIEIKESKSPKAATGQTVVCGNCGTPGKPSDPFCGRCGVAFNVTSQGKQHPATSLPPPPIALPENQSTYSSIGVRAPVNAPPIAPAYDFGSPPPPATSTAKSPSHMPKVVLSCFAALFVVAIVIALVGNSIGGNSVEKQLDQAINRGNLFPPAAENAHDLYNQLKASNAGDDTLRKYRERLVPLLISTPNQMLASLPSIGGEEPTYDQWRDAARNLNWAVELNPADKKLAARAAYCEGRAAFVQRQNDPALQSWNRATDLDPAWALPVNGIGLIYQSRKDYGTSRSYFQRAMNIDPSWPHPYENLGNNYLYEKNYVTARGYYQKALEKAPEWAKPHWHLGQVAMQLNDFSTAVTELQAALAPSAKGLKGNESQLVQKDLDRAQQKVSQFSTITNY